MEMIISEYVGFWMLLSVALVFFMQGGFAMVETGLTRAKNAGNIIMKNLMDFCIGAIVFWLIGFGLLYGNSQGGFIGALSNPFAALAPENLGPLMFNLVFCATAATIVSGAMAERTKFSSYCLYSLALSLFVYPIEAHWIWNADGWLAQMGFVDFAGSAAVHLCGGVAALIGAKILGPRIGKYKTNPDGTKEAVAIPGHSLTLAALGVFILWFCWYGFNGAAATTTAQAAHIYITTTLAAAVATVVTMVFTWVKDGKPDVSMSLNGSLAGLVAVTAGCANVDFNGAAIIGLLAGLLVVIAVEFFDKKVKIDDPVGAISVHGACGALGTLLVGLFDTQNGLFYGGGLRLLGVQALGVLAVVLWVSVTMGAVFLLIRNTVGLRVSEQEEIEGLDSCEHNLQSSYADFVPVAETAMLLHRAPEQMAYERQSDSHPDAPLSRIKIILNQNRFEALKTAMERVGVAGMTVTHVLGCGTQTGKRKKYRGTEVDMQLLPKLQVDIVVSKVPVDEVIRAAREALYTGGVGDGKIFVYGVQNVVRIRTGEQGYDALQIH